MRARNYAKVSISSCVSLKKAAQVKAVGHGVVEVHGQWHGPSPLFLFILSPGDHWGKEPSVVEHMEVAVAISYPGQAGDVEEVGCLPRQDVPAVPVGLLVRQELGVKGGQIEKGVNSLVKR